MNEKLKQLQARLFDIGAYGKNATRAAEVDGKMGKRTKDAVTKALKMGYYVDLNKGTVTNVRIGSSTSRSSSNFSPKYGQTSNDPTNVPGYNPTLGGRLAPGQGYGLPEVTVTANPRGHSARAQRTRTTINGKTVQQVKQKRKVDTQMRSIEGDLDFATARGQQHNVTEQERAVSTGRFGPVQQYVKDIIHFSTAKEGQPDIRLTNGDFSDSYNRDASRLAQIAYRQYVRAHGYPAPGTTFPFSLEPSVYKEVNKDGRYAHFTIPNIINAALGGSNQVEFTDGGMSGSAYVNPETGKVDVHWTDKTAWDLTDRERTKFQSEGGIGNAVRLFMEKAGSKGEDNLPDYVQSLRYSIPYDTISGNYRGRLRGVPAYYP